MKIALTGGPSAGKTSAVELLYRGYSEHLCIVPEAASLLFHGGFPRENGVDHLKSQQRAIYHVQKELEYIGSLDPLRRHLICDRGSIDTLAYWPDTYESFFKDIGSTLERELARYDWVIHLDTVPGEDYKSTNLRTETNAEALAINSRIRDAWKSHPRRFVIEDSKEFILKMNVAIRVIDLILSGSSYDSICMEIAGAHLNVPLHTHFST